MPAVPFEYLAPATLRETLEILHARAGDARPLAGGQSLIPMLTLRLARPSVVVDLHPLAELRTVRRDNGMLEIGALVRHRALEHGEGLLGACPVLQEAASLIGNVRVRTLGTIGGSLAHADPAAELPAVVRALDGMLVLQSLGGERTVPARDFFTGLLTTALRPDELLVAVRLPAWGPRAGSAVEEFSRRAGDFAVVASVAVVELDPAGRVARARVALAGVGATPQRLAAVEDALVGTAPSGETFRKVLAGRPLAIEPDGDAHASSAYRRHLARVLTARALERAAEAARRSGDR
jgi:aerobic carbon-monoxide dehydrogenase medium subunit